MSSPSAFLKAVMSRSTAQNFRSAPSFTRPIVMKSGIVPPWRTRPITSHRGAYSRLDRPSGARSDRGRNRFQNPRARASGLSSSITGFGTQGLPAARALSASAR